MPPPTRSRRAIGTRPSRCTSSCGRSIPSRRRRPSRRCNSYDGPRVDPAGSIAAADADPTNLEKAGTAADIEVAQGAPDAAFERLLVVVRASAGDDKAAARTRWWSSSRWWGCRSVGDRRPHQLANALF